MSDIDQPRTSPTGGPEPSPAPGRADAPLMPSPALPPYAASPGYAPPTSSPGAPPHTPPPPAYTARQLSPGAPPTWTPPPAEPSGSAFGVIALCLAVVGALAAFVPFYGTVFAWLFLVPAIVLAIIALVRRAPGRGFSVTALIVSGVALVVSVLWGAGSALFGGLLSGPGATGDGDRDEYSGEYVPAPPVEEPGTLPLLVADPAAGGATREESLPFGSAVTLLDDLSGDPVWSMTVSSFSDVSDKRGEFGELPANGAYVAAEIELTNLTEETIDFATYYEYTPYTWLLTGDGGRADGGYRGDLDLTASWAVTSVAPGETITYYDAYDVAPQVIDSGYLVLQPSVGDMVYWGPAS